jgi:hypothetical protein
LCKTLHKTSIPLYTRASAQLDYYAESFYWHWIWKRIGERDGKKRQDGKGGKGNDEPVFLNASRLINVCFLCVLDKVDNRKKGRSWAALFLLSGTWLAYLFLQKTVSNENKTLSTGFLPGSNHRLNLSAVCPQPRDR